VYVIVDHIPTIPHIGVFKEFLLMPRPKSPKKTNGVEESAVTANSTSQKSDGALPANTTPSFTSQASATEQQAPAPRRTGKPEIVKSDSRSNLFPINLEDEIRRLAYLLSERRGFEPGHETEDWLTAEREVRDRYHQQIA
jgi:hypothetical protein